MFLIDQLNANKFMDITSEDIVANALIAIYEYESTKALVGKPSDELEEAYAAYEKRKTEKFSSTRNYLFYKEDSKN